MGREYVFSAHILSLSTGPLSNPAGLAFDHLLRCFCFNRSTFFFPKVNEKLIDIIIGFFESALCTSFVALPSILNYNKKNGPNPHPASLRSSNDPERSPSLIKRISRRTWHTPIPDGLCERYDAARSSLSPHSLTFSLSANTFSILTEALRSVSSLRCV